MARKHKVHIDIPVDSNPYVMWQGYDFDEEEPQEPPKLTAHDIFSHGTTGRVFTNFVSTAFTVFLITRLLMAVAQFLYEMFGGTL